MSVLDYALASTRAFQVSCRCNYPLAELFIFSSNEDWPYWDAYPYGTFTVRVSSS